MASKTYPVPPSDKGVAPLLVAGGVSPTPLVHAPPYGATQALPPPPVPRLLHTAISPAIIHLPNNRFFRPAQPLMATPSVRYAWPQTPMTPGGAVPSLFWDGSKARCRKTDEGRLITPAGTTLCSDWNNRRGCSSSAHELRHECSGCGSKDHGAQKCPRAQKKQSPPPL